MDKLVFENLADLGMDYTICIYRTSLIFSGVFCKFS